VGVAGAAARLPSTVMSCYLGGSGCTAIACGSIQLAAPSCPIKAGAVYNMLSLLLLRCRATPLLEQLNLTGFGGIFGGCGTAVALCIASLLPQIHHASYWPLSQPCWCLLPRHRAGWEPNRSVRPADLSSQPPPAWPHLRVLQLSVARVPTETMSREGLSKVDDALLQRIAHGSRRLQVRP